MRPRFTTPAWADLVRALEATLRDAPVEDLPECVGDLEGLKIRAWVRISAPRPSEPQDQLLTAEEAALRLRVPVTHLYRKDYPFKVRLSPGRVRFSSAGIERFIRSRRASS
jgi:predicted DNA-binding transcriptional regulator AlpA